MAVKRKMTNHGFLKAFKERHEVQGRPFCWVLGAGASFQSGIPTGRTLATTWLQDLYEEENDGSVPIEHWATAASLDIPGFEYARVENFYPWIYQRRFGKNEELGYAVLEKLMDPAEPSFGYSVLAQLMSTTSHKVAVTTNFDNLIAEALSVYSRKFPLMCGHESLAGFIQPYLKRPGKTRPLIVKIHRDLFFAPRNKPKDIDQLPEELNHALRGIFDSYTPIVIGYGGNDGSLMGLLESLERIEGGVFWCYLDGSDVDPRVEKVVESHDGRLVPIAGFDELMVQLQEKLQLPLFLPHLRTIQDNRVMNYQKQFEALTAELRKPAGTKAAEKVRKPALLAAEAAVERLTQEKDWWAWQLKADAQPDLAERDAIYRKGLSDFPDSAELVGNFALFLHEERKDYDEAEKFYKKALKLNPTDATYVGNFANFLTDVREQHDDAERYYRQALELDPRNALNTGNFAVFMHNAREKYEEAEQLYRKALDIDPNDVDNISNFAQYLAGRGQAGEARELAVRAWQLQDGEPTEIHAQIAFIRWLQARGAARDGTPALRRLKMILETGFERSPWTFEQLLETSLPQLPENERALAQKLADAILDEANVEPLEDEPLWKEVKPIPLSIFWPDDNQP